MKLRDLVEVLDEINPVWLNVHTGGGHIEGTMYENSGEMPFRYRNCEVSYVTQTEDKVLTIEIEDVD